MNSDDDDESDLESGEFHNVQDLETDLEVMRAKRRIRLELQQREDEQFEDEWGYSLVKALRGKTVGRRFRRKIFKFGCFQGLCGFALLMIAIQASQNFKNNQYMDNFKYGSSLTNLLWTVSFPSTLLGFISMMAVRNWASLVTNRALLSSLMRIYMGTCFILFIVALWCACVTFLTFRKVKDWGVDIATQALLPYFICIAIFLMPYLAVLFLYTLDVSYLTDEVERGGTITELDPPENAVDLSDVTLFQSCVFVCGMPCIVAIQFLDLFTAVKRAYNRYYKDQPVCTCFNWFRNRTISAEDEKERKKKARRTIWFRMYKTCMRCFKGTKPKASVQPMVETEVVRALPLRALEKDREQDERDQREKILLEQEAERQRIAQQEAQATADFIKQQEDALQEAAKRIQMRGQEEEERKKAEEFVNRWEAVLTVTQFKSLWSTFPTNGSFQCNLKTMPNLQQLVDHLKKQGFHIVFAVSPNANSIEVGICNIRPVSEPNWFMARFLAANNSFSAVMKSDNTEIVPALVKKFALAKVLKIETPGK